jgi:dienelactone hydrolase
MCLLGCPEMSRRTLVAGLAAMPAAACAKPPLAKAADVQTRTIGFNRDAAAIDAFVAVPASRPHNVVAVLHGNAGIPADVRDTAIWAADLGYAAIAVNSTARYADPANIPREVLLGLKYAEDYLEDTRQGIAHLRSEKMLGDGKVGVFGFCGGGYVGLMWGAAHGQELGAIVGAHVATQHLRGSREPYRRPPGLEFFNRTRTPVQLHQGGADEYTPPEDLARENIGASRLPGGAARLRHAHQRRLPTKRRGSGALPRGRVPETASRLI